MRTVTLDSNCLYALLEKTEQTRFVQEIVALHKQEKIRIQIPLVAAYENRRGTIKGRLPLGKENLEEAFREKIKALGLDNVVYLPRLALLGDALLFPSPDLFPAGQEVVALRGKIIDLIHPGLNPDRLLEEYKIKDSKADFSPKWNNQYRDILIILCHIMSKGDVLVSNDKKIYEKAVELKQIGAGTVLPCTKDGQRTFNTLLQPTNTVS